MLPVKRVSSSLNRRKPTAGFTLLEVLVASTILGVAVVGMLSTMSTSVRNTQRLTDYEQVALVAKARMDSLLADPAAPRLFPFEGAIGPEMLGGNKGGWRAQISPFEPPPGQPKGVALERIELEIWWMDGSKRRSFQLEAFRRPPL